MNFLYSELSAGQTRARTSPTIDEVTWNLGITLYAIL